MHSLILSLTHLCAIRDKDRGGQIASHSRTEVYDADPHRPRQLFEVAHQPVLKAHTYQHVENTVRTYR